MAPNAYAGTSYGALVLEAEEAPKTRVNRLLVAAAAAVVLTVSVFAVVSSESTQRTTAVVDADQFAGTEFEGWTPVAGGPGVNKATDCKCSRVCDRKANPTDGFHYCDVIPTEECVGVNNRYYQENNKRLNNQDTHAAGAPAYVSFAPNGQTVDDRCGDLVATLTSPSFAAITAGAVVTMTVTPAGGSASIAAQGVVRANVASAATTMQVTVSRSYLATASPYTNTALSQTFLATTTGVCSVLDGTAGSASYPCTCGTSTCVTGQRCNNANTANQCTGTATAARLTISDGTTANMLITGVAHAVQNNMVATLTVPSGTFTAGQLVTQGATNAVISGRVARTVTGTSVEITYDSPLEGFFAVGATTINGASVTSTAVANAADAPTNVKPAVCRAACDYVSGRYDCWSFPCFNGGFCIDGVDTYTCHCTVFYDGEQCENDVDECAKENKNAPLELAVCDEQASCQNSPGRYSCECNAGWEGDGYREDGTLVPQQYYSVPPWFVRPDADSDGTTDADYLQACRDINDCNRGLCRNGATCINLIGVPGGPQQGYECECPVGLTGAKSWVGHDCETDVDECDESNPIHDCDPHATCMNLAGSFACKCNVHWQSTDNDGVDRVGRLSGTAEDVPGCYDYPDCSETPCLNGATCNEGPDGCEETNADDEVVFVDCYTCTCAYGWTGFNCEIDENECNGSEDGEYMTMRESCHDEAFCTNSPGSFECACNAGWTGDGITCIDADDCEFSPCAHGGTCYDCGTLCFTCDCVVGWRGTTCGTDWNECLMGVHMCNDEATCINNPGSYTCRCDPGFTGDGFGPGFTVLRRTYTVGATTLTETTFKGCKDIDDCDPGLYSGPTLSPNGPCVMGTCMDVGANAYVCSCTDGWTDQNCDMNINECDPILGDDSCHRFATCKDTAGSYTCQCNAGFTGNGYSSCLDISDCYGQCVNGFCSDLGVGDFSCTCDEGYMDRKCDEDINECTTYTHECARHASCINNAGSYSCDCNRGWSGDGLAQGSGCKDIDDCASNPCDFGECTDEGAASYTCDCQEGFTDFNCDYDVNECYLKTHTCHVDARCVNVPGGFFCRCLSGFEGDGLTCTDLDDCDPDPCDPIHGTCEDRGQNLYKCECMDGWCSYHCEDDCDECADQTDGCDANASCLNTYGSHECTCNKDFWGDGTMCTPCSVCTAGWKEAGVCEARDLTCVNVDECVEQIDNCNEHATCTDNQGSFKCECDQNGDDDEWWGVGTDTTDGCTECTDCFDGYHEIQPCTSTTDRTCEINVASGLYMIESEADDNKQCVAMLKGEWYPSRVNFGNGEDYCGFPGRDEEAKKKMVLADGQAVFKFNHIGNKNDQQIKRNGDLYTIEFNNGGGYQCIFFGNKGKDIYPSLQNCNDYDIADKSSCPWKNGGKGQPMCGYTEEGMNPRRALLDNGQAIWKVTPLKLNEDKFLLQSASKGRLTQMGDKIWECLAFENNGAATNPSRYNWGNGDTWCGAGDWEGRGKVVSLLNNKQAVMILTYLQGA